MIKIYRNISTIQAKEVSGNKPTHYLKATTSREDKEGALVASLWAKTYDQNGETKRFLSGEMKKTFIDQDGNNPPREGFVIASETDLNNLLTSLREYKAKLGEVEDDPTYPKNEDSQDIPF